uniref:FAD/NAD(P)-binding domain-containing protein n=1 Tax=Hucho hucho TaxID=62062 RepID=A0A4W5LS03_9TELE
MKPKFADHKNDKNVAIIGSGPAGISAATFLLRKGFNVEMFERSDRAGGLLMYGIPGFKLDKTTVDRRINWLLEAGMKLHVNCEVGNNKSISELDKDFDAIFLGIGSTASNKVKIDGEESSNVHFAIDFLTGIQKRNLGNKNVNYIDVKDKKVVVIGGGDTAMDCVRTSVREGAESVKCLYRRDEANMPGSKKEVVNAKEEGVEFVFNVIVINEGTEYLEDADIIILALGFSPESPSFLKELDAVILSNKELHTYINTNLSSKDYEYTNTIGFGGDNSLKIDLIAENIFIKYLKKFGNIYSEECGLLSINSEYTIIVDPLD